MRAIERRGRYLTSLGRSRGRAHYFRARRQAGEGFALALIARTRESPVFAGGYARTCGYDHDCTLLALSCINKEARTMKCAELMNRDVVWLVTVQGVGFTRDGAGWPRRAA
jgi:hypothetical protein